MGAKMKALIQIKVTAEHIQDGLPTDAQHCPIALALRQRFRGSRVAVDGSNVLSIDSQNYDISLRGMRFIDDFDQGLPVLPSSFRFRRWPLLDTAST